MTNEITLTKAEFKLDLAALGFDVMDYQPGRINAPQIIMRAGTPYLTVSSLATEYDLALELIVVAAREENEEATEALDEMLATLLPGLPAYAQLNNVDAPMIMPANNANYLVSNVSVTLQITL